MTSESSAGVQDEVHAGRSGVEEVLIGPLQGVHQCSSVSFEKLSVQIRHEDQCAQTGVDRSRCPQVSSKSFSNTMTTTLLGLMSRRFREICSALEDVGWVQPWKPLRIWQGMSL